MNKLNFVGTIVGFAAAAHATWRQGFEAKNGAGTKRMKPTLDGDWLKANDGQSFCDTAGKMVNINIPFEQLPADWQTENVNAANLAMTLVLSQVVSGGELDSAFIEEAASEIHDQWVLRQRALGKDNTDNWFAGLSGPYAGLPEGEKEKDRVQVRGAIEAYNSIRN